MNRFAIIFAFLGSAAFAADQPNTLTAAEKAAGWKLLFDGKTSDGWVAIGQTTFPTKGWKAEDGALHHTPGGGGGDIVTQDAYENYELSWEWKIAKGGNGGIKYNLPDPKKGLGFEYQLIDDDGHADAKKGGGKHQTASLYDLFAPAADRKLNPAGEWNQSRIIVKGNHVEHWLNGTKTVEFELGSETLKTAIAKSKYKDIPKFGEKTKSPILIQDHGDEIWLWSIKLRAL
jgi:3-keto-disaccharide hydrolase